MAELMKVAESYFQNLLLDTEATAAVAGIAGDWGPRVDERKPMLGLSRTEYVVQICRLYTGEVGNGGHEQLFVNHGGEMVPRIVEALEALSLGELGAIFSKVLDVFPGGKVPAERDEAEKLLESLDDKQRKALGELDRKTYAAVRNVDDALIAYLRKHADDVLRGERGLG